jgi:hypothetical protein
MAVLSKEKFYAALRKSMDTSSLLMITAAVIAVIAVYLKSPKAAASGIGAGISLLIEIAPHMVAAFTLAGLVQAIVPQETIVAGWVKAPVIAAC